MDDLRAETSRLAAERADVERRWHEDAAKAQEVRAEDVARSEKEKAELRRSWQEDAARIEKDKRAQVEKLEAEKADLQRRLQEQSLELELEREACARQAAKAEAEKAAIQRRCQADVAKLHQERRERETARTAAVAAAMVVSPTTAITIPAFPTPTAAPPGPLESSPAAFFSRTSYVPSVSPSSSPDPSCLEEDVEPEEAQEEGPSGESGDHQLAVKEDDGLLHRTAGEEEEIAPAFEAVLSSLSAERLAKLEAETASLKQRWGQHAAAGPSSGRNPPCSPSSSLPAIPWHTPTAEGAVGHHGEAAPPSAVEIPPPRFVARGEGVMEELDLGAREVRTYFAPAGRDSTAAEQYSFPPLVEEGHDERLSEFVEDGDDEREHPQRNQGMARSNSGTGSTGSWGVPFAGPLPEITPYSDVVRREGR